MIMTTLKQALLIQFHLTQTSSAARDELGTLCLRLVHPEQPYMRAKIQ